MHFSWFWLCFRPSLRTTTIVKHKTWYFTVYRLKTFWKLFTGSNLIGCILSLSISRFWSAQGLLIACFHPSGKRMIICNTFFFLFLCLILPHQFTLNLTLLSLCSLSSLCGLRAASDDFNDCADKSSSNTMCWKNISNVFRSNSSWSLGSIQIWLDFKKPCSG